MAKITKKTEAELKIALELADKEYDEWYKNIPLNLSYQEFQEYMRKASEKSCTISRLYRLVKTPTYQELPDFGDIMTLKEFVSNCKCGGFIDYDGSGNYIKDGKMSDIDIFPSDIKCGKVRKDFDQIIWFNR
jgi:hypothetical protein